jgi:hypothetical protein
MKGAENKKRNWGRSLAVTSLFVLLIVSGCEKIGDLYLGVPLQPKMEKEQFVPGLNILGVIRPDSTGRYNNSFVHVGQILPAVGDTSSDWELMDAVVVIQKAGEVPGTPEIFTRMNPDSLFKTPEYRPDSLFRPMGGERYSLTCSWGSLPVLQAETRVPSVPLLSPGTLSVSATEVRFSIKTDSSVYLLDIYLITEGKTFIQRHVPDQQEGNTIIFSTGNRRAEELVVFAYDKNLADYYVNSNVSLNFNKYRRPFSYVENGYGVFGSMNLLRVTL